MTRELRAALLCLVGFTLPAGRAAALAVVTDGQPRASIVVAREALAPKPSESAAKVRIAADDLRDFIERMSGAKLPIIADDASPTPQGTLILVGKSRLTESLKLEIPDRLTADRAEEGFVIACAGAHLVLAGNDQGPYHGTEYAVYRLLERLGVHWYMPGEFGQYVPALKTIDVPDGTLRAKPDFIMRGWWSHMKEPLQKEERRWKVRNGMTADDLFDAPGDSSVRGFVADKELTKTRPELFAKTVDGRVDPYLPNLSNPEAVRIAAEKAKAHFRKRPGANSTGIAPDDGMPRDFTPETVKLNQGFYDVGGREGVPAEASVTEEWIGFVNAVAREVKKEFPDKIITTNGYANRNTPPVGVRPDENLGIMFAAIWCDTLHAYDDPRSFLMRRQGEMLREWCRQSRRVWLYNYEETMLVTALTPVPLTRKLARDFPLLKRWGCIGFADEARNQWAECGIQTRYLRARLMWDANSDAKAILDDYFAHWYGPAVAPARAFWEELEQAIESTPLLGHEDRILPYIYTPRVLDQMRAHLADAEKIAADKGDERVQTHVRIDHLIFDHLLAYVAMNNAEFAGNFNEAAKQADRMLSLRRDLKAINPFLMTDSESQKDGEYFYFGVTARAEYYRKLADMTGGKTGELIALLPEKARFQIDPHDDGRFAGWYQPQWDAAANWPSVSTTQPFYAQGYQDKEGHPYIGAMWYRFEVDVPASAKGKAVKLYSPVVETEAWCWVNGQYTGHRKYREAYERPNEMDLDVSKALKAGERNLIAIRVTTGLSPGQMAGGLCSRLFLYAPKDP
ncbi:MAG TPA: DUF4838 domain-containing protein [Tepidisphaeraceae bacterium]|jgi:hypothetical protein